MPIMPIIRAVLIGLGTFATIATGDALGARTHVELGAALAVGGVVAGAALWMGREFQGIRDRDSMVKAHLALMENLHKARHEELKAHFAGLPCERSRTAEASSCPKSDTA